MSNVRLMIVEESAEVWLNGVDYESVQQVVITIEVCLTAAIFVM